MRQLLLTIFLTISTLLNAQDYRDEWTTVMRNEANGEIKAAATAVNQIYLLAKKDKNEPQLLKTFFFRAKYMQVLEEDAVTKILNNLKSDKQSVSVPAKAIMESLYGQMLKQIYDTNRYKIRRRTDTDTIASDDFLTWTTSDYEHAIDNAYRKSIENKTVLEAAPLERFHPIIDFALPHTHSRPVYDFLLERYIEYGMLEDRDYFEHSIIESQMHLLFGNTKEFVSFKILESIPDGLKESIALLMDIEKRYAAANDTANLRQAVLRRLDILSKKLFYNKEKEAYLEIIGRLANEWHGSPYCYKAKAKQAALLYELADKNIHPDYLTNALLICEELTATSNQHNSGPEAEHIRNQIIRKTFNVRTEKYLMPNKPSLANVAFQNIDTLQLQVFKVSIYEIANINHDSALKDLVSGKRPLMTKGYHLLNKKDYFNRETEVVIPPLEKGSYIFCFSNSADMDQAAFVTAQVSGKSLIQQSLNEDRIYQLLDCVTGKPIKNAVANYSGKKIISDSDGKFKIDNYHKNKSGKYLTHKVKFTHEGDTLTDKFTQYAYIPDDDDDIDINARIQLYLDRAIYRPGQKMFFKGIVVQEKGGLYSTVSDIYVSITITGPSGEDVKKLRLKVNEFGSFTGECIIPAGGLTGEYTIEADADEDYDIVKDSNKFWDYDNLNFNGEYIRFSVEEYKRPTFQVKFDPVKEDITINEEATVSGSALSFSGAPVSGAEISYRVHRASRSSSSPRYAEQVQVAVGKAVTDQEGKFWINFTVLPDPALPKEELPVFTYTVYTDVTDIGGETQAGQTKVLAGYHSLLLNAAMPRVINAADKNFVTLTSQNLNGEPLPVKGEVIVFRLDSPARILATRALPVPEIQPLSEEEFVKLFPHLPYSNSQSVPSRGRNVYSAQVDTNINTKLELSDAVNWESGKYKLVFSAKDSVGNLIESTAEFSLTENSDLLLPDSEAFKFEIANKDYRKDGYIEINLRSSLPLLYVNLNAYSKEKNIQHELIVLKDGRKKVKIPLNKAVEGRVHLHFDFVWQNGFYQDEQEIIIPDAKVNLGIETIAITDKLRPGSEQTWSFRVNSTDKLPSEVLASMYDASLDQFALGYWSDPGSKEYYAGDNHYRRILTSGITYAYFNSPMPYVQPIKTMDVIYTYGFSLANGGKNLLRYSPKQQLPGNGKIYITGTVSDREGKPISDATLIVESTYEGVDADQQGRYSIYADPGDQLRISGTHFIEKRVGVATSGTLNIFLERSSVLEEVGINIYRSTIIRKSSAAVSSISIESIEDRANATVLQNLQGQVAGLNIATGSGQPGADSTIILRGVGTLDDATEPLFVIDGIPVDENAFRTVNQSDITSINVLKDAAATAIYGDRGVNGVVIINTKKGAKELEALQNVQARRNFDETAFFYPQLVTDRDGKISFTFTTPEALTEWKLRLLAHNIKGNSGYFETTFVTQKDLMVVPNMPRFVREKDTIVITAKISNLTTDAKTGSALLHLSDAMTMQPADSQMQNLETVKPFSVTGKGSTTVSWKIAVPEGMQGVHYKIVAKAGDFTDGEENILPVLTNNMLVTESIPLWVKPNTTKEFTLENLNGNTSTTLRHHAITLEYTSNPAWLALQSLPYLMEFEHECAEQVFSRYYANAIAAHVLKSNPKIAEVFAGWKKDKPVSRLEQNEELKSVILAETPWLLDTQSEEDKKARLAILFEFDAMSSALNANFEKLYQKPGNNGGFCWFDGGNENEFITRHILAGFGHLNKLGITPSNKIKQENLLKRGVKFIDDKFLEQHTTRLAKKENVRMWHYDDGLHYLYTRSFYTKEYPLDETLNSAVQLYLTNIRANWKDYTLYQKGMAALTLNRFNDSEAAKKIIRSLSETSSNNEEWGMYWIENKPGWYWSQAPVETQALLIEAFMEVNNDIASGNAMKVWLIKNKQNKNWPTTKATTGAVYALLMQGSNWLAVEDKTTFKVGDNNLLLKKLEESKAEAGSGYVKLNWKADEVSGTMAKLTVTNGSAVPGYGGYYWQYFEDLDRIKPAQDGIMNVAKELYLKKNTTSGQQLQRITSANPLQIGDLVTIRLVITTKEDMEYVHLKDLRAAAFEPVSVLSGYQWKDGLGFYQSTRDVATHFFFDRINKGTYVLEYDVRINNAGEFSNGITTIQSMYAPEFSSHTKGMRISSGQAE